MKYFCLFNLTGLSVRAINRPGAQLLGANGRDDGPLVSFFSLFDWNPFNVHQTREMFIVES